MIPIEFLLFVFTIIYFTFVSSQNAIDPVLRKMRTFLIEMPEKSRLSLLDTGHLSAVLLWRFAHWYPLCFILA
jgi:hypothetical protein